MEELGFFLFGMGFFVFVMWRVFSNDESTWHRRMYENHMFGHDISEPDTRKANK